MASSLIAIFNACPSLQDLRVRFSPRFSRSKGGLHVGSVLAGILATRHLHKGVEVGFGNADARRFDCEPGLLEWVLGNSSQEFSIHWNEELLEHWEIWHRVSLGKWGGCGKIGKLGSINLPRVPCL